MKLSISRWRPGHLFAAWGAYWVALAAATLAPAIVAIARVASSKGNVSLSLGDWVLKLTVNAGGTETYTASAHVLPISLWVAGPPLALFALWLRARSRAAGGDEATPELLSPPAMEERVATRERERARRG